MINPEMIQRGSISRSGELEWIPPKLRLRNQSLTRLRGSAHISREVDYRIMDNCLPLKLLHKFPTWKDLRTYIMVLRWVRSGDVQNDLMFSTNSATQRKRDASSEKVWWDIKNDVVFTFDRPAGVDLMDLMLRPLQCGNPEMVL